MQEVSKDRKGYDNQNKEIEDKKKKLQETVLSEFNIAKSQNENYLQNTLNLSHLLAKGMYAKFKEPAHKNKRCSQLGCEFKRQQYNEWLGLAKRDIHCYLCFCVPDELSEFKVNVATNMNNYVSRTVIGI